MRSSSEMTMPASSTSWCWTVSSARSIAVTTMSRPPSACSSSLASSSWKWVRVVSDTLADLAGDVCLRARVGRVREDLVGVVELDDAPAAVLLVVQLHGEEGRLVGHARRLLHVVRDDHDRVLALQVHHEVLDLARGDRVERRARLVHQDHVGLHGEAARDAEPLLLAAGHAEGVRPEAVLDLVPERGVGEGALHDLVHVALHAADGGLVAVRDLHVVELKDRLARLGGLARRALDGGHGGAVARAYAERPAQAGRLLVLPVLRLGHGLIGHSSSPTTSARSGSAARSR